MRRRRRSKLFSALVRLLPADSIDEQVGILRHAFLEDPKRQFRKTSLYDPERLGLGKARPSLIQALDKSDTDSSKEADKELEKKIVSKLRLPRQMLSRLARMSA